MVFIDDGVVAMKGCPMTNAKDTAAEVRDPEGCFVRDAGSERRFRPVFGRL